MYRQYKYKGGWLAGAIAETAAHRSGIRGSTTVSSASDTTGGVTSGAIAVLAASVRLGIVGRTVPARAVSEVADNAADAAVSVA